ncbi:hypothetical protein [Nostoc sp.]|uniref:hypothetical protein n=1 Tax=Nostoc sp. TaxID=1180 RepID=UPI003592F7B7
MAPFYTDLGSIPITGLITGLITGPAFVLMFVPSVVLIDSLIGSEVDIKKRPNQGIWKSTTNALFIALVFGLMFGLFGGLTFGLIFGLSSGAGKAATQHIALRLTLYRIGIIPWNYARFLNYCTERCFLQRVGGRYRFIHKQLQDHFAEMLINTTVNE